MLAALPVSALTCLHCCKHIAANALLQVAVRTNQLGVFYWDDTIPMAALLEEGGTIDGQTFLASWRALPQEAVQKLDVTIGDIEAAKARLGAVNLFVLAHRPVSGVGDRGPEVWCVHALMCCKGMVSAGGVTSCSCSYHAELSSGAAAHHRQLTQASHCSVTS
jgi:hypothetical protein